MENQNGFDILRELSKSEPGGHWGSVTNARLSLDGIWTFEHLLSYSRYLSDIYPKLTCDSLSTYLTLTLK